MELSHELSHITTSSMTYNHYNIIVRNTFISVNLYGLGQLSLDVAYILYIVFVCVYVMPAILSSGSIYHWVPQF